MNSVQIIQAAHLDTISAGKLGKAKRWLAASNLHIESVCEDREVVGGFGVLQDGYLYTYNASFFANYEDFKAKAIIAFRDNGEDYDVFSEQDKVVWLEK